MLGGNGAAPRDSSQRDLGQCTPNSVSASDSQRTHWCSSLFALSSAWNFLFLLHLQIPIHPSNLQCHVLKKVFRKLLQLLLLTLCPRNILFIPLLQRRGKEVVFIEHLLWASNCTKSYIYIIYHVSIVVQCIIFILGSGLDVPELNQLLKATLPLWGLGLGCPHFVGLKTKGVEIEQIISKMTYNEKFLCDSPTPNILEGWWGMTFQPWGGWIQRFGHVWLMWSWA